MMNIEQGSTRRKDNKMLVKVKNQGGGRGKEKKANKSI